MKLSLIAYIVISDIHLGHDKNKTEDVVDGLIHYLKVNHNTFKNAHIFILAGDIFEKLLATYSREYKLVVYWLSTLANYCKDNNIKLRILEGTPSHDWRQVASISESISVMKEGLDFKYVDTLSIEHIEDLGINVLYVPDEWNKNIAVDNQLEITSLLQEHNLSKVDITIGHLQFNYQLPISSPACYSEEFFLGITKYFISAGHIHTSSVFQRIVIQGSFGRDRHGEEEDKGGMFLTIYKSGDMEHRFIKNTKAKVFNTYGIPGEDLHTELLDLDTKISKLPKDSYIRIKVPTDSVLKHIETPLKAKYKFFNISVEANTKKSISLKEKLSEEVILKSFEIKPDNIKELLMERVNTNNALTGEELILLETELDNVITL